MFKSPQEDGRQTSPKGERGYAVKHRQERYRFLEANNSRRIPYLRSEGRRGHFDLTLGTWLGENWNWIVKNYVMSFRLPWLRQYTMNYGLRYSHCLLGAYELAEAAIYTIGPMPTP